LSDDIPAEGTMNARTDQHLDAGLKAALRAGWPKKDHTGRRVDRYLRSVVEYSYEQLRPVLGRDSQVPPVVLHAVDDPAGGAAPQAREDGSIFVGLRFMDDLGRSVATYCAYLMENYAWQIAPPIGDVGPFRYIVSPEDFPREALSLYAANFIPGAVASDGYVRSDFASIMQSISRLPKPGSKVTHADMAARTRSLAKPPLDVYWFNSRHGQEVLGCYRRAPQHYLRLHGQLLTDATQFILAHEAAHIARGHVATPPANLHVSRNRESEADLAALQTMAEIEGFELRSLVMLFGFMHFIQESPGATSLSHPFSDDRLASLYGAAIARTPDEALRADINAGMSLLYSDHGSLEAAWPGGEPASIRVSSYSDSDYSAYMRLHVSQTLRGPSVDASEQIAGLTFGCDLALRSRDDPDYVLRRAQVRFRPGKGHTSLAFHADGTGHMPVESTHTVQISPPPEFWLDAANATIALGEVWLSDEALPEKESQPETEDQPVVEFLGDPDDSAAIDPAGRNLATAGAVTQRMFVVAARRFAAEGRWQPATDTYGRLYAQLPHLLLYSDLMNYIDGLQQTGRIAEAADVARVQLRPGQPIRPGYHLALAYRANEEGAAIETLEHLFWELNGVGESGRYQKQASILLAELANRPDPSTDAFFRCVSLCHEATSLSGSDPEQAARYFNAAMQEIAQVPPQASAEVPPLFAMQSFAEAYLQLCDRVQGDLRVARRGLESVHRRYPEFAPTVAQLARVAAQLGDVQAAREYRDAALALAPSNQFVLYLPDLDG
jgi:tetratricopeptide (TPR) repeat protein